MIFDVIFDMLAIKVVFYCTIFFYLARFQPTLVQVVLKPVSLKNWQTFVNDFRLKAILANEKGRGNIAK